MKKERKRRNRIIVFIAAAVVILTAVTLWAVFTDDSGSFDNTLGTISSPDESNPGLRVSFIDVGQGDCILLECGGKTMLVDAGEKIYEQKVSRYLLSRKIKTLDYIVATHPHSDHIGSLPYIMENFGTKNVIMPRIPREIIPTNYFFDSFIECVSESDALVTAAQPGLTFMLGTAQVTFIGPVSETAEDLNNLSAVCKVTYGETSLLLTGDAAFDEETEIINSGMDIKCDILKLGHHGSGTSTGSELLEKVSPKYCVISCGENNDYGHPAESTLKRILKYTDKIYRTDRCGTIVAESDGKNIVFTYGKE
ncbi:MAG: MBL fold metallo-hydrolase [Clostridia bacterium]|nr:MBL fold metallo-hydrolase [Clostridia bacterium]